MELTALVEEELAALAEDEELALLAAVDLAEVLAVTLPPVEKTFTPEGPSALQPESTSDAAHINIRHLRFILTSPKGNTVQSQKGGLCAVLPIIKSQLNYITKRGKCQ